MNAWLTIDFVAKRYGCLPSQVLKSGDNIDIKIAALAVEYEIYLNKKEKDKAEGKVTTDLTVEEMTQMIENVRKNHGKINKR